VAQVNVKNNYTLPFLKSIRFKQCQVEIFWSPYPLPQKSKWHQFGSASCCEAHGSAVPFANTWFWALPSISSSSKA
jgi:hypothetical protein